MKIIDWKIKARRRQLVVGAGRHRLAVAFLPSTETLSCRLPWPALNGFHDAVSFLKRPLCWLWSGILALLSACSSLETPITLQPVGPAPLEEFTGSGTPDQGYLVVYSEPDILAGDTYGRSRYLLLSGDGKLMHEIKNHTDRYGSGPTHFPLPAGTYKVKARGAHSRNVIVPVVIKGKRTTFVHLEDSASLDTVWAGQTNIVKLPDGQIVGWAATGTTK